MTLEVSAGKPHGGPGRLARLWDWDRRSRLSGRIARVLIVLGVLAGLATYAALTESPPFGSNPEIVTLLLNLDLAILLLLSALVAYRFAMVWAGRRRGAAGSRLHMRLVALFSVLAVAPAITVAAFSALFFHLGVNAWFSERIATAVTESQSVAKAYLEEHQAVLRADALAMANDINREAPRLAAEAAFGNQLVATQAMLRSLTEAAVIDGTGGVVWRAPFSLSLMFESPDEAAYREARGGDVVLLPTPTDDRVRALIHLPSFIDTYLLVGRLIEPEVIAHMERAEGAVAEYSDLQTRQSQLQITFLLIYVVIALLLLMTAVWIGLAIADTLVQPVGALIDAAERVRGGDLGARVSEADGKDEIGSLGRAFNRMTRQLSQQRQDLIDANAQLDHRRRFTESVLAGVSAGVLGLDQDGRIDLPNRSALELLDSAPDALIGRRAQAVLPELEGLLAEIRARPNRTMMTQIQLSRAGESKTLLVRIVAEREGSATLGYVVTFDDVTELLAAQRKAAWADVARRIAHEIKNPLTPIQLAAERLRRRYSKEITSDPGVFTVCVDTIIRHVGDIGRMVSEFSEFARMPAPVFRPVAVATVFRDAIYLQKSAHPHIRFTVDPAVEALPEILCDESQVSRVLTNVLQNAVDAIDGRTATDGAALPPGEITVGVTVGQSELVIEVADNGRGLPAEDRHRLTEPYVTTRAKGTGLGLAIVKKIMEDHRGRFGLYDGADGGARAVLAFPIGGTAPPADPASAG